MSNDYSTWEWRDVYGHWHWRQDALSDDLFRCKRCGEVTDKDQKNGISVSKWSTKATAKASLCDKCFTNYISGLDFKMGDWKEWPKRGRNNDD